MTNIKKRKNRDEELSRAFTPISLLTASNRQQHAFKISNDSNLSNVFHWVSKPIIIQLSYEIHSLYLNHAYSTICLQSKWS